MWTRLREAIVRDVAWVWRRRGRVRELIRLRAARRAQDKEDSRQTAARARFWAELREGQREAEAQCSRRQP
jgi:hypothetical protein